MWRGILKREVRKARVQVLLVATLALFIASLGWFTYGNLSKDICEKNNDVIEHIRDLAESANDGIRSVAPGRFLTPAQRLVIEQRQQMRRHLKTTSCQPTL